MALFNYSLSSIIHLEYSSFSRVLIKLTHWLIGVNVNVIAFIASCAAIPPKTALNGANCPWLAKAKRFTNDSSILIGYNEKKEKERIKLLSKN